MTTVLAVVSDLHTNSTIGLCPPRFQLDDGGEYVASKAQRWLWASWLEYVAEVERSASANDSRIVTVFNGDLLDGDHHGTAQIITRNKNDMLRMAFQVIEPLVTISESVYVVRGTVAHTGKSAWMEEAIADDIDAVRDSDRDTASWWHLLLNVDGVTFDIAHHGTTGYRPWTRPNAVNRMAAETIIKYASVRTKIPDVVLRAHRHQYADSAENYVTRVIQMPAFQLASAYVHQIAPGALADIGGLIFTVDNGDYSLNVARYRPAIKRAVKA